MRGTMQVSEEESSHLYSQILFFLLLNPQHPTTGGFSVILKILNLQPSEADQRRAIRQREKREAQRDPDRAAAAHELCRYG